SQWRSKSTLMDQQEISRKNSKNSKNACTECVKSKRKCVSNSSQQCERCIEKNLICTYHPHHKKRGPKPNNAAKKRVPKSTHDIVSFIESDPSNNFGLSEENDKKFVILEITQEIEHKSKMNAQTQHSTISSNNTTTNIGYNHCMYSPTANEVPDTRAQALQPNNFRGNYPTFYTQQTYESYDFQLPLPFTIPSNPYNSMYNHDPTGSSYSFPTPHDQWSPK
ncbi:17306_t:CDS:2, partial [Dentiscutata heterogama]